MKSNNSQKQQNTPHGWLSRIGKYEAYKLRVEKIAWSSKCNIEKYFIKNWKEFLLYEGDPKKDKNGFIEKNLVDTRYATRLIFLTLSNFFAVNKQFGETKIKNLNGSFVSWFRKEFFRKNKKDRNDSTHHAIDAIVLTFIGSNKKTKNLINLSNEFNKTLTKDKFLVDKLNNEVSNNEKALEKDEELRKDAKILDDKIREKVDNKECKFSRPIRRKNNLQLSNETIYSVKWDDDKNKGRITSKISLLDNKNLEILDEIFNKKNDESKKAIEKRKNLLCYEKDKKLFDLLYEIYNQWYDKKDKKQKKSNPFNDYMVDKFKNKNVGEINYVEIEDVNSNHKWKIKYLKYLNEEKNRNFVIPLKNHNNKALIESLNPLFSRVYKKLDSDKLKVLMINAKFLKHDNKSNHLLIDENKIIQYCQKNGLDTKKYLNVYNGTALINKKTNELFYFTGGGDFARNKLELKRIKGKKKLMIAPKFAKHDKKLGCQIIDIEKLINYCRENELDENEYINIDEKLIKTPIINQKTKELLYLKKEKGKYEN